jgi:hypothetical protein
LAVGWREAAKELGALQRRRNIRNPSQLLRTLLIYITGRSLREAVAVAQLAGIARLSDMALLKRLRKAVPWLRWLAVNLLNYSGPELQKPDWLHGFKVKCVDATTVGKPGGKGTDWRLHFSFGLFDMGFEQFQVTDQAVGESLRNYTVQAGDLLLGDRGYAHLNGLDYVITQGGDFLVRLGYRAFKVYEAQSGGALNLFAAMASLNVGEVRTWQVFGRSCTGPIVPMRVCATRLPRAEARQAQHAAARKARRKAKSLSAEALAFQSYVVVATSVSEERLSGEQALKLYRLRWQIEIAIKRLKTIIGVSELPCRDKRSGQAWLHGKLVLALLTQVLLNRGQQLQLIEIKHDGTETTILGRYGNLWREMRMILELIAIAIVGEIYQEWHPDRWRVSCQLLQERQRRRLRQHALLFC